MAFGRSALAKRNVAARRDGAVGPENLADSLRKKRWCFENFMQEPFQSKAAETAAPGGTALQAVILDTGNYRFQYATTTTETDQFYITLATDGGYNLTIPSTTALEDGIELNFGGDVATHPRNFTGSSEDFFARCLFSLDDASALDIFFGVKKAAATVATLTEITDVYGVRILGDSSSATAAFTVITNLNNGGSTDYTSTATTVTALADATDVEIEVGSVKGKGYVKVNGVVVSVVSYTFDSGDRLSPILRTRYVTDADAQSGPAVRLYGFECGLTADRTDGKLIDLVQATA